MEPTTARSAQKCSASFEPVAGEDYQRGLELARRGEFFEAPDRRVVLEDVVAQFRLSHCAAHLGRRQGHGVATKVDPMHRHQTFSQSDW